MKTTSLYDTGPLSPSRLFPVVLLACTLLNACATYRPATDDEAARLASSLRVGDVITCDTRIGPSRQFKIRGIEDGWLIGDSSERVFLKDVKQIKVWRHALGDTALHATGAVVTLGALSAATQGFSATEGMVPAMSWRGMSASPSPSADQPHQLTPPLKTGETITCETRYGGTKTFRLAAIEQGWLMGDSERVYIDDIKRVEPHRPAKGDAILAAGLLLGTAVVLYNTPLALFAAAP